MVKAVRRVVAGYIGRASSTDKRDIYREVVASIWVRSFLMAGCLVETSYRVALWSLSHVLNTLYGLGLAAVNGYVYLRFRSDRLTGPGWPLLLSVMDVAAISFSMSLSGGIESRYFVLYYPTTAVFAWVFTSPYASMGWATMVAAVYCAVSLLAGPGLDMADFHDKHLFYRVLALYGVVGFVNVLTRFEMFRRVEAVERERELQRERVELSQSIHDTAAQTAYLVGLGIDGAIRLAGDRDPELAAKLAATSALSRSAMWELRRPIDMGRIFEGMELGQVLESHARTFARITSVPVEVARSGEEPPLAPEVRTRLFSVAHNALANALLHAGASRIEVRLEFQAGSVLLSVSDDGVGLPEDYARRGRGFSGMGTDAERMGGSLEVQSGGPGEGTAVTCVVPLE